MGCFGVTEGPELRTELVRNLLLRLPADEMAEVDAALKGPIDRRFADARHAGRFEPPEAYAADVAKDRLLGTTPAPGKRSQAVRPDKKGVDVLNVTHLGRQVTATQRTALEARGATCECCGSTWLLDIDHNEGWALTHDTRVEDLSWACWHCHDTKTHHDLRFAGPPGNRHLVHRDGTPWRAPPHDEPAAVPDDPVQHDLFSFAT